MAQPKRLPPAERARRRAVRSRPLIDELVSKIAETPCPECGKRTLEIETFTQGIVIGCSGLFCNFKPPITARPNPYLKGKP